MSLKSRLMGRVPSPDANGNGAAPTATPSVTITSPMFPPPVATKPAATASASGMYTHRIEEETLGAVDQLKIDLHRKLIERLDLDALEKIKDERVSRRRSGARFSISYATSRLRSARASVKRSSSRSSTR